eukprot:6022424-Prymnesium_polylepis.1
MLAAVNEADEAGARRLLLEVYREFWIECEGQGIKFTDDWVPGLLDKQDDERTAFEKLKLDVYFTLQPFIFGDDGRVDAFEYVDGTPFTPPAM